MTERLILLLALKMEEVTLSHGMWGASGSWKKQGSRFSSAADIQMGMQPYQPLDFSPVRFLLEF